MTVKDWVAGAAYTVRDAAVGVMRHKRRSIAMASGIVLGMMIISSILIYTSVLQEENYRSIIQSASFEAYFTLAEPGRENLLWNATHAVDDDPRIESMAVFGGIPPRSGFSREDSRVLTVVFPGDVAEAASDDHRDFDQALVQPLFVRSNFTSTTIYDRMVGPHMKGEFDLSLDGNRTVISRYTANRLNLEVGDTVATIIVAYRSNAGSLDNRSILLRDVAVTGIYENQEVEAAGIFSEMFNSNIVYLNTELLYEYDNTLLASFEEDRLFYLALKINQDEFTLGDVEELNSEIDRLVNDITRASGDSIVGSNQVGPLLQPFSVLNYFIVVFDFLLVLPTVILSVYLLVFGLELSLEERRREIAILKVQGADSRQIFKIVRNETLLLLAVGLGAGYALATVGAWLISSSTGFMLFDIDPGGLRGFIRFDIWAFAIGFTVVGGIVLYSVRKRARHFINMEVTEGVQRLDPKKEGFIARNKLDVAMLAFGSLTLLVTILDLVFGITEIFGVELTLGIAMDTFILGFFGTVMFWVGGALAGPRVARWTALRLEKAFLGLGLLSDVAGIIRSGLRRRRDVARLVLIIVLTLSVSTMAAVQGYTDHMYSMRTLEYEIGADYKIEFASSADRSGEIEEIPGVADVMPLPYISGRILSTTTTVYGVNPRNAGFLTWHEDCFTDMSPDEAMSRLRADRDVPGVFLGEDLAEDVDAAIGDQITLRVFLVKSEDSGNSSAALPAKVLGTFNHAPGGIGSEMAFGNFDLINAMRNLTGEAPPADASHPNATAYLVGKASDADPDEVRSGFDRLDGVILVRDLEKSKENIGNQMNFGVPGLLTMTFVTSFIGALISAYAFSSIIMKRREREFAVLQTIGASRWQVYKTAIGENFILMLVSVLWGVLIGLGVSYKMNGFFGFIGEVMGRGELERVVFVPWAMLAAIAFAALLGMLLAVVISARKAARLDLSVATRVV